MILPNGEIRFGRAGVDVRRAQRIAARSRVEAERVRRERAVWPQMALVPCLKPHRWATFTSWRGGSPLCPACGWTKREIRGRR